MMWLLLWWWPPYSEGESGTSYPPLPSLGSDDSSDILRIKRHRTMPHRGG